MGCGKSTLGHMVQEVIQYGFLDTDHVISEQLGQSIPDFFKQHGEPAFRDVESQLVEQLIDSSIQHHVISTGGGIITSERVRELLPELGFVVWLTASPKTIHQRTKNNNNRPLLNTPDPQETIRQLLEKRIPYYQEVAHLKLSTDDLSFQEIVAGILESASYYFGTHEPS